MGTLLFIEYIYIAVVYAIDNDISPYVMDT